MPDVEHEGSAPMNAEASQVHTEHDRDERNEQATGAPGSGTVAVAETRGVASDPVATVVVENPRTGAKLTLAKPTPLSDEAQHVINSLEAHFAAVREAVKHGTPGTLSHAERAMEAVHEWLGRFGLKLAQHELAAAERDAARAGGVPASEAGGFTPAV